MFKRLRSWFTEHDAVIDRLIRPPVPLHAGFDPDLPIRARQRREAIERARAEAARRACYELK